MLDFLRQLGARCEFEVSLYLLGGSALALLGNPRQTQDLDYTADMAPEQSRVFRLTAEALASEMRLDLEEAPITEFVPLPPNALERRRFVGRFGKLNVYIFDLYTLALSKIARGFESDLNDVLFMLGVGLIEFGELERLFEFVLPKAPQFDIDRREFRQYFEEVRRRTVG